MKVKFQDDRSTFNEYPLKIVDLLIALRPGLFWYKIMHPNYEDIFIMRTVKDTDFSFRRDGFVGTP